MAAPAVQGALAVLAAGVVGGALLLSAYGSLPQEPDHARTDQAAIATQTQHAQQGRTQGRMDLTASKNTLQEQRLITLIEGIE